MRILLVKTSSLGDIIHAFPVVSFLHAEFPHVKMDWVIEKSFSDIVKAHPLVNNVIEMDTKGWRKQLHTFQTWQNIWRFRSEMQKETYDVVIDLQGNTKSAIPTFLAKSKNKIGFGWKTSHEWPNILVTHHRFNPPLHLNVRDENLYLVQQYFQRFSSIKNEKMILKLNDEQKRLHDEAWSKIKDLPGEKILICPGSAWRNKQLSYDSLKTFLTKISDRLQTSLLLCWGTQEELILVQKLQDAIKGQTAILDRFPLPVLQNLMSKMDLVIAMDSLPLHLAGISGVPTFSIFGASSAQKYKPMGPGHKALQGVCSYGRTFERRCPILRSCPTGLCIQGLSGEELFAEFYRWKNSKSETIVRHAIC